MQETRRYCKTYMAETTHLKKNKPINTPHESFSVKRCRCALAFLHNYKIRFIAILACDPATLPIT